MEAEVLRRAGESRRAALLAAEALRTAPTLAPLSVLGAQCTLVQARLDSGDLPGAAVAVDHLLEGCAVRRLSRAAAFLNAGLLETARGGLVLAHRYFDDALRTVGARDRTGTADRAASELAWVCMATGDADGVRSAMEVASGVDRRIASAFVRAVDGELVGPAADLCAVAAELLAVDRRDAARALLHHAVRLGDLAAARILVDVAALCDGALAALQRAHAASLVESDASGLFDAAEAFERLGYLPCAADAFAQSAILRRAAGQAQGYADAVSRMAVLREQCAHMLTPAVRQALRPVDLTTRESEVVTMTDRGLAPREIAARLDLHIATVRDVGSRARAKLGVVAPIPTC